MAVRSKTKTKSADSFKSVARRLECDESEAAFDKSLGKIARASVPRKPIRRTRKPLKLAI